MSRLTYKEPDGRWGIIGMNETNQDEKMYGVAAKLRDYEETGLSPAEVEMLQKDQVALQGTGMTTVEDLIALADKLYLEKCQEVNALRQQLAKLTRPKVYAVDFDGTLCISRFPEIIAPRNDVIEKMKQIKATGHKIILWTCRQGDDLEAAVRWCKEHDLEFDAVNDALPEQKAEWNNDTRKVWADYYIDDKAMRPEEINVKKCVSFY